MDENPRDRKVNGTKAEGSVHEGRCRKDQRQSTAGVETNLLEGHSILMELGHHQPGKQLWVQAGPDARQNEAEGVRALLG
jgi:hypothetical protein